MQYATVCQRLHLVCRFKAGQADAAVPIDCRTGSTISRLASGRPGRPQEPSWIQGWRPLEPASSIRAFDNYRECARVDIHQSQRCGQQADPKAFGDLMGKRHRDRDVADERHHHEPRHQQRGGIAIRLALDVAQASWIKLVGSMAGQEPATVMMPVPQFMRH